MSVTATTEAKVLDLFDAGEDVLDNFVVEHGGRTASRRLHVGFLEWAVYALDDETGKLGINRQAVVELGPPSG